MSQATSTSVFDLTVLEFKQLDPMQRRMLLSKLSKKQLQKLCRNMGILSEGHQIELNNRLIYMR